MGDLDIVDVPGMFLQMVGGVMAVAAVVTLGKVLTTLLNLTGGTAAIVEWVFLVLGAAVGFGLGFLMIKMFSKK